MYWNLVHKFLSGQCTEAERRMVQAWLEETPENRALMRAMRKIWEVKPKGKKVDVKRAWNQFRTNRMKKNEHSAHLLDKAESKKAGGLRWYQKSPVYVAAAAVILFIAVSYVVRLQINKPSKITFQQVVTKKGERSSLKLNDGTKVQLNAESTLKIPSNYGAKNRTLYLEGEAYFSVIHDESKPFRVYSKDVYAEDIGTEFDVQAFPEDSSMSIVVAEGKVALKKTMHTKQKPVLLASKERAVINRSGKIDIANVTSLQRYIGWTQNTLVFDNASFKEVMKQIERWYGMECVAESKVILSKRLTATFQNEPLSSVLKLIAKSMGITAKIDGKTVKFNTEKGQVNNPLFR